MAIYWTCARAWGRLGPRTMMRFSLLLCCGIWLVAGCRDDHTAQTPAPDQAPAQDQDHAAAGADARYQDEVADICFAEERSGALAEDEGARIMVVAQWLGTRIHTQQGRDFLAAVARATPAEKAALLQAEATRLGLASCPLVQSWSGTAPAADPATADPAAP
jgi:hypothetical protein